MKSRLLGAVSLLIFTSAVSSYAGAATITFNLDIDLDSADITNDSIDGSVYETMIPISSPILNVGDVVDTTVNFIGGERLTVTEITPSTSPYLILIKYLSTEEGSTSTNSVELLGLSGEFLEPNPFTSFSGGTGLTVLGLDDYTNSSFSFNGIHVISDITTLDIPYTPNILQVRIQAFPGIGTVSIVPVPTAVWLFGSGLIGLVGVARHK